VGLYQVNFVVPPASAVTPYVPCSGSVNWNLMVTLAPRIPLMGRAFACSDTIGARLRVECGAGSTR
jgi:hypothetical protein